MKTQTIAAILLACLALAGCLQQPNTPTPWEGLSTEGGSSTWADTDANFLLPCIINTTVASNLTGFVAWCSINTTNTTVFNTTHCGNLKFYDAGNITILPYDIDDNSSTFCGNATNNVIYWVRGNYTGAALTTIYAYIYPTNTSSYENESGTWSDYISVWHLSDANDLRAVNTMSATGTVAYALHSGNCKFGNCVNLSAATASYLSKTSATHPVGANASTFSCWGKTTSVANTRMPFTFGTRSTNQLRDFYYVNSSGSSRFTVENYGASAAVSLYLADGGNAPLTLSMFTSRYNGSNYSVFINGTYNSSTYTLATGAGTIWLGHSGGASGELWAQVTVSYLDECRLSNISFSDDWVTASWAQTSTTGMILTNAQISASLSSGIYYISFRPIHGFQHNVLPVNSSESVPLFVVTPLVSGTSKVNISQTPAISGFSVRCAPHYNQTGAVSLNTTSQWITNVTYPTNGSIWCWADFNNPQAGLKYNITVVPG